MFVQILNSLVFPFHIKYKIYNLVQEKISRINESDGHTLLVFIISLILPREKARGLNPNYSKYKILQARRYWVTPFVCFSFNEVAKL